MSQAACLSPCPLLHLPAPDMCWYSSCSAHVLISSNMPSVAAVHDYIRPISMDTMIDIMAQVIICVGLAKPVSCSFSALTSEEHKCRSQLEQAKAIFASGGYVVHNKNSRWWLIVQWYYTHTLLVWINKHRSKITGLCQHSGM